MAANHAYRPSHLGVCVSDLERALRFYCDGLGFELAEGYDLDDQMLPGLEKCLEVPGPVALRSQMIVRGGMKIELLAYRSPGIEGRPSARRNLLGLTHLWFHVDDLEVALAHLVACGGRVLPETRQSPGVELVFVADPDGTRIELMRVPS